MQIRTSPSRLILVFSMLLAPALAQAHPGFHAAGFLHGTAHPLTGLDHICAMIAVGLWAAQRGGRAVWLVPVSFVSMMLVGGTLGAVRMPLPQVETGIALSVLVLGLLVCAAVRLPMWASALIVGIFAIFHGFAHTTETPMNVSVLTYGMGFLLSTAALHVVGIGLGLTLTRLGNVSLVRFAGGAIAVCGVVFLAS